MGVDHGGRGQGDKSPQNLEFIGDANANCPLDILSYRYQMERSGAFKIRQNPKANERKRKVKRGKDEEVNGQRGRGVPRPHTGR